MSDHLNLFDHVIFENVDYIVLNYGLIDVRTKQ